jgi:hypothetical protein
MKNGDLNQVCPYFTMFPLGFPQRILARESRRKAVIMDPFCGRGTSLFAGRLRGFRAFGFDSNPTASAIAEAKLVNVGANEIAALVDNLMQTSREHPTPKGEFWRQGYHVKTLRELCLLRHALLDDVRSDAAKALRVLILGALHGPLRKGAPAYFSNQMPRTFAPKPGYAVKFWKAKSLSAPRVCVRELIARRAQRFFRDRLPRGIGSVTLGDSRDAAVILQGMEDRKADWIITSPPYYGLNSYIADHWLRLWFLGGAAEPRYESSVRQISHRSSDQFASDLREVWHNAASVCNEGARLVLRFGSINNRAVDPLTLIKESLRQTRWRITTIRSAGSARDGYRQAESFRTSTIPRPEFDVWAVLEDSAIRY